MLPTRLLFGGVFMVLLCGFSHSPFLTWGNEFNRSRVCLLWLESEQASQ